MLATKQPILRRFWYPTVSIQELVSGPQPFELLGQKLVLWLNEAGKPVALADRCPHRSVPLSNDGAVVDGTIRCGYHGWRFNSEGACTYIPQSPDLTPSKRCRVESYHCTERYGYVWVCLDEPLADIPHIPEAFDSTYRLIPEYAEIWQCNAFRVTENALDVSHISFVHRKTFGDDQAPVAPMLQVNQLENGVELQGRVPVANDELQQKNLRIPDEKTLRIINIKWLMPCTFLLHFTYPNGLIHLIVGFATPVTDQSCYRIQFCLRNDTEADAPTEDVAAFDRSVGKEDRQMLESTDYDLPLNLREEHHMLLDKPGIMMRRQLAQLLKKHGEVEQRREIVYR
ncbi:aromatic ring-hydroxylating dioxygenase subunit alpha [Leptolyngbya sp. FACHB-36]|uniref:aromatic ring-hydroxylating dioxygenase subunit alpha n=1 Tax=Leptolyngbya sp. FACHB-36 TaxID=2692808 RepID=UPI001680359B|nr:aromatic ring-hydroxylating dioxygenase subunit alpha [Leptolyngbya sp. FACHB-36]MBD2019409.1 aromatic ring-hydroxylating dioxygenase subunit alpha [Leptolyngbya sp. FACHB-36]